MVKIKICGIRQVAEAEAALEQGADFLGFIFYPPSPRYLEPAAAARLIEEIRARMSGRPWAAVGVFVNEPASLVNETADRCGLDFVQLHGTETADYCAQMRRHQGASPGGGRFPAGAGRGLRRVAIAAGRAGARLLGWHGGAGGLGSSAATCREGADRRGLTPTNVQEAIATLRPWGLDVSSGVEREGEGRGPDPRLLAPCPRSRGVVVKVEEVPAPRGRFGEFGGQFVPEC